MLTVWQYPRRIELRTNLETKITDDFAFQPVSHYDLHDRNTDGMSSLVFATQNSSLTLIYSRK